MTRPRLAAAIAIIAALLAGGVALWTGTAGQCRLAQVLICADDLPEPDSDAGGTVSGCAFAVVQLGAAPPDGGDVLAALADRFPREARLLWTETGTHACAQTESVRVLRVSRRPIRDVGPCACRNRRDAGMCALRVDGGQGGFVPAPYNMQLCRPLNDWAGPGCVRRLEGTPAEAQGAPGLRDPLDPAQPEDCYEVGP